MRKVVVAGSTFLWKKPAANEVLAEIQQHLKEELHTYLTSAETMKLCEHLLVESEVIYGTVVEVLSEVDGWSQVIVLDQASNNDARGYPGYILTDCLAELPTGYAQAEQVAVIVRQTELIFSDRTRALPFGTVLGVIEEQSLHYVVASPEGSAKIAKTAVQKTDMFEGEALAKRMVALAEQFIGLPYIWAGISGCGFDCSGLMYSLHRVNGVLIPRDTPEQAASGVHLGYAEALPGDLLLFAYEQGKGAVHHVGMYLGNGEMIHSHTPGSKVIKSTISGSKYEEELRVVARYWC